MCPRCRNIVPFNIEQWIGTCIFKIIQINFTSNVTSIPEPSFIYSNQFSQVRFVALYYVGKLGLAIVSQSLHLPLFTFIVRTAKMPFPVTWKTQALLSSILKTRTSPPPERVSVITPGLGRYIPVGACSMLPLYWLRVLNHVSFTPSSSPRSKD